MVKNNNILLRLKEDFINPLFLLLFFNFSALAQENNSFSNDLFNFNHKSLHKKLQEVNPETNIFYHNKSIFLQVLFNEIPLSDRVIKNLENSITTLENHSFTDPKLKLYYIGESQLILSLIQMKQGQHFRSAHNFIKAYDSFEKNLNTYPAFKDPEVALKFMEISASVLPKSLKWITSWFGVKSDKSHAFNHLTSLYYSNQLSDLAKKQCYAISLYLKLHFNTNEITNKVDTSYVLFNILQAEVYGKNKNFPLMIEALLTLPDHLNIKHFLLGKAYFITENKDAQDELNLFIDSSKTSINTSAAYFYLYQLNILNYEDSLYNLTKLLKDNPNQSYRDKWAKSEIKNPQSALLIQVRNVFDQGQYKRCIQLLNTKQTLSTRELYYLTNSYISLKQIDKAKQFYHQLLKRPFLNQYYIPKTGYNLAELTHLLEPNFAKSILKSLNSYKNYPYQSEIETKSELLLRQCD